MSSEIRKVDLSYVLTTFNKLKYLQITLPRLVDACAENEEIVIYDGGSSDGSLEYLQDLFSRGLIHQFKSEKDYGEANGYNKAMIAARGELIKIISDDDVYDYNAIRKCKEFMLEKKEIHLVAADGFGVNNLLQRNQFSRKNAINDFFIWKKTRKPFIFCGLSIMLRKDALPLLGFWSTNYLIIDFEYTLRVSAGKAKIGWYTGMVYVNIVNDRSNSGNNWRRIEIEKEKLEQQYFDKRPIISYQTKDKIKNIFRPIKYKLFPVKIESPLSYEEVYRKGVEILEEANKKIQHELLT
jgi:glycosyltransferase involved in cell wall biosynthesis